MRQVPIHRWREGEPESNSDWVAEEEPLEIRLGVDHAGTRLYRSLAVTMRTPGADEDLAVGFLLTEGVVGSASEIVEVAPWGLPNVVRVDLASGVAVDWKRLERNFYVTSSCGVCGKTSLELVEKEIAGRAELEIGIVRESILRDLPARIRGAQTAFETTGGLHAATLFSDGGDLLILREDVGRHNAVDKVIGARSRAGLGFAGTLLLLSGRAGFELIQKAALAGIPVVAALGAPTSLAVELADQAGITLIGFLKPDRFNVYCGAERIRP